MHNVIQGLFHPDDLKTVRQMQYSPDGTFKSAQEIAHILNIRLSVVKAVLRKRRK